MLKKFNKNHIGVSKKTAEYVIARDNNRCIICGVSGDYAPIQLCHIVPRSNRLLIDEHSNIFCGCYSCHKLFHSNTKYWMAKCQSIVDEREKEYERIIQKCTGKG